jgi:hypothetical protein
MAEAPSVSLGRLGLRQPGPAKSGTRTHGDILNIKSGRVVEIEQRTLGKMVWAPDDAEPSPEWPAWTFSVEELGKSGTDLAVAVSLTHDVSPKVRAYVQSNLRNAPVVLSQSRQVMPVRGRWLAAATPGRPRNRLMPILAREPLKGVCLCRGHRLMGNSCCQREQ